MAAAASQDIAYTPASQVADQAPAASGTGPRGQRIHYFHQPGQVLMFFDPADGSTMRKHFSQGDNLPKFARTFWTDHGRLFLFGGKVGNTVTKNTLEYSGEEMKFLTRADMNYPRSDITVVYVPHLDRIYVLGGNDNRRFYEECEYYEPAADKWTEIAKMRVGRDSGAAALLNGQYIYAFSGRNKFSPKTIVDVVERYDINANTWEDINVTDNGNWVKNDLSLAWQFGHNQICVFGGVANGSRTEKCYLFDTQTNRWNDSTSMTDVGSYSVVPEMANNKIYILGWTNSGKKMFVWDSRENTWTVDSRFSL